MGGDEGRRRGGWEEVRRMVREEVEGMSERLAEDVRRVFREERRASWAGE
jgi:hypothetical protein